MTGIWTAERSNLNSRGCNPREIDGEVFKTATRSNVANTGYLATNGKMTSKYGEHRKRQTVVVSYLKQTTGS
jgi:hypothetical protein